MPEFPDFDSTGSRSGDGLDLYMTVVKVASWSAAVAWYRDNLGLAVALLDEQHEFALLTAGGGRLGLQGTSGGHGSEESTRFRLVFRVHDVDAERARLVARGVEVSLPIDNREEGFREIRLHDPDRNSITLFGWATPSPVNREVIDVS